MLPPSYGVIDGAASRGRPRSSGRQPPLDRCNGPSDGARRPPTIPSSAHQLRRQSHAVRPSPARGPFKAGRWFAEVGAKQDFERQVSAEPAAVDVAPSAGARPAAHRRRSGRVRLRVAEEGLYVPRPPLAKVCPLNAMRLVGIRSAAELAVAPSPRRTRRVGRTGHGTLRDRIVADLRSPHAPRPAARLARPRQAKGASGSNPRYDRVLDAMGHSADGRYGFMRTSGLSEAALASPSP